MKLKFSTLFFTFLLINSSFALTFEQWKKDYARRAAQRGIETSFTMRILSKVKINHKIIKKDKKQLIFSKKPDYNKFIKRWLKEDNSRIREGKKALKENDKLLTAIEKKYGVDKEIIVALWGVETFYGRIVGDYNVIQSLATLAYEGRRRTFYEIQLNAALRLIKHGDVTYENFIGSWAGATGQCQFMPSNIKVYGQDFDKDGHIDIWRNKGDIFASIAYLLKRGGWKKNKSIGSLAYKTKKILQKTNWNKYKTLNQYHRLGLRGQNGKKIKKQNWSHRRAATIPMQNSPLVLRGSNYSPLMRWNKSALFAAFNILLIDAFEKDLK